jgi:dTDP-4-amino-4,6-dideoxygalactose transaminase
MTMDIEEPGYKFHMNDICASLGLIGLSNSDIWLSHRREIGEYYKRNIKHRVVADGAYWLACIFVKNRDKAANFLKSHGVETNMAHLRNDIFKVFGGKRQKLPNMDKLESQYLYIPLNLKVNIWDAEKISKLVNELP